MKSLRYKKIDAFTSGTSLGNPAACIYMDDDTLTEKEMLDIAKSHKGFVSEMVYAGSSAAADVKLTYYSSEMEVDFCGHGTIACMYDLIKNIPALYTKKEVLAQTNKAGLLTVYNEIQSADTIFISAPNARYIGTDISPETAADELGLPEGGVSKEFPIDIINAGLSTLIVPISGFKTEINVFPDEKALKEFCLSNGIDIVLIFCLETADKKTRLIRECLRPSSVISKTRLRVRATALSGIICKNTAYGTGRGYQLNRAEPTGFSTL